MPTYIVTSPEGKKFKVTGQGSKEQALAHIQTQYSTAQPQSPIPSYKNSNQSEIEDISKPIDTTRPILENDDGTFSTEETITIDQGGRFFNIPTIVNGERVGEDQAIELFNQGINKAVGEFGSLDEAVNSAEVRTQQIGKVRKGDRLKNKEPFDFSASEMVSNIPGSAVEFGKNMVMPFLHPIDTAKSVGRLGLGVAEKAGKKITNQQNDWLSAAIDRAAARGDTKVVESLTKMAEKNTNKEPEYEKYADQMGKFVSDRYGSIENLQKTVQDDPVGFLSDFSMLLTGGGSAAATLPGKLGKAGQAVKKVGMATEPLNIVKGAAKTVAAKVVPKTTPVGLYESSAKFSTTFPKAKRTAMAETALKHEIMPTAAGLDKMDNLIGGFNTKIDTLISDATKAGKTIPRGAVYKHLKALRRELGGTKMEASADLRQINQVAKTLDLHLKKLGKTNLTPDELQSLKTDAYSRINFDAKQLRSSVGKESARKAVARGTKEAIEGMADVKELNKELGKLYELKKPLSRSAARIENRNVVSIDAPIKIGAGQAAGGAPGAAAGTGLSILEHPKMKARIAIKLKKIQDAGLTNMIDQKLIPTLVHYGLMQSGRAAQLPSGDDE